MEIHHFSHEHPLILSEEKLNKNFQCGVCGEHIFGLSYCCAICPYVLHKWCSELPRELPSNKHHLPNHPLVLTLQHPSDPSSPTLCNDCRHPIKEAAFAYTCAKIFECIFSLHVECASFPEPLTTELQRYGYTTRFGLQYDDPRTRNFKAPPRDCFLCGVGETSFMLHSPKPDYLFSFHHIQCEMLPQKVKYRVHLHELILSPPRQENEWYTEFLCDACEENRDPKYPIYNCESCEFVAHIGCGVTGSKAPIQNLLGTSPIYQPPKLVEEENEIVGGGEENLDEVLENLIHGHKHEHPLVLQNIRIRMMGDCCIGCGFDISGLAYRCETCRFYLHKHCANLSQQIECSKHPDHGPLVLSTSIVSLNNKSRVGARCECCGKLITKDHYTCEKCDYALHCLCALLPNNYKHPSHEHTLTIAMHEPLDFTYISMNKNIDFDWNYYKFPYGFIESPMCQACRHPCQDVTLGCKSCNFYLHVHCFLLPQTGKHITHMHNLSLAYTYKEDPRALDFFCDCCETPRTPNRWVYRCMDPECEIVAHVNCIVPYPLLAHSENPN